MYKPLRLTALLILGLAFLGGCESAVGPDESTPAEAARPLRSAAGVPEALGVPFDTESTATASDTTGRSGVYIGSGH